MECVTSLPALVEQCCLAALAAQSYLNATYGLESVGGAKPDFGVAAKGPLGFKGGAQDLVTELDFAVQHCVTTLLAWPRYSAAFAAPRGAAAGRRGSLHVVGEEADAELNDDAARAARRARFGPFYEAVARDAGFLECCRRIRAAGAPDVGDAAVCVLIDPIDATVALVGGDRGAPMTLIGVAVDGVPRAGVANRLFRPDRPGTSTALPSTLSVCCDQSVCALWGHALGAPDAPGARGPAVTAAAAAPWRVTFSDTITAPLQAAALAALRPFRALPLRGGGNKLMHVAVAAARRGGALDAAAPLPDADVFLAVADLRQWDTCAPHAFLRALGGDLLVLPSGCQRPLPIAYLRDDPAAGAPLSVANQQLLFATAAAPVTARVLECLSTVSAAASSL